MTIKEYYPNDDILDTMSKEELKSVIRCFTITDELEEYADENELYDLVLDEDHEYELYKESEE